MHDYQSCLAHSLNTHCFMVFLIFSPKAKEYRQRNQQQCNRQRKSSNKYVNMLRILMKLQIKNINDQKGHIRQT